MKLTSLEILPFFARGASRAEQRGDGSLQYIMFMSLCFRECGEVSHRQFR